jgi:glutamate---cysteine ligase / carboxylate-amine ligase
MSVVTGRHHELRSVGVEEELLLFERGTTHLARLGDALADPRSTTAQPSAGHPDQTVEHEFKRAQIETATKPHQDMTALRQDVETARIEVARRANAREAVIAALATDPAPGVPVTTRNARYGQMVKLYGAVADNQLACGLHVHVSVDSDDEGVQVIDRLRPWLPVLLAMSANSPYHQGQDTRYASFRSVMWGLWPTSGPTELFGSVPAYRARVDELVTSGAALDEAMIYFDARLSPRYPTVEIRVMDIVPTPDDTVMLAALCRALVETAADDARHGRRAPELTRSLLRAMTWRAARFGVSDELVRPDGSKPAAAFDVIAELVEHVRPALDRSLDSGLVDDGVRRLLTRGSGADMQRNAFSRRGLLTDVVAAAVEWTTAPGEP